MARSNLPIPKDPDQCPPWLYEYLKRLNQTANKTAVGIAQVARGEVPDGSGQPLPGADTSGFFLLAGRGGGQIGRGGRTAGENLTLSSTDSSSKGKIFFGLTGQTYRSAYDETQGLFGINLTAPVATAHVVGSLAGSGSSTLICAAIIPPAPLHFDWGDERSGAGGAGTGFDALHALTRPAEPDDITTYIASNTGDGVPVGGNPQRMTLTGTVVPGASYRVTTRFAPFSANSSLSNSFFQISLVDSAGNEWRQTEGNTLSASELSATAQVWANVIRTVTCSGTPASTGNTPNAVWLSAQLTNEAHTLGFYSCVSYISVTQAGSDIIRWDLIGGTRSGRIDVFGRMGINTGSASLDAELTVIPDAVATVGLKVKALASQTGDLIQLQNSSAVALGGRTAAGAPYLVAGAAVDALLVSDASGVGAWLSLVSYEDEILFYEDSPVYV